MTKKKIRKLLIANRGEIACKIIKCAQNLNIPTVAIYSNEDADSLHVHLADESVNIPGSIVSETYMNGSAIINICKKYIAPALEGRPLPFRDPPPGLPLSPVRLPCPGRAPLGRSVPHHS